MKKLTLDKTWELCLEMWKWIAGEVKKGKGIGGLKGQWLKRRGYKNIPSQECFFCEYDNRKATCSDPVCVFCPGVMVNRRFRCTKKSYNYLDHPIAFYNKLVSLNKIRLAKKKK